MNEKTRKEVVGFGGMVGVALITGGSVMVANQNPLGYLILLTGLTICWSIVIWMKWLPVLSRPMFRWGGSCLIVLACVIPLCLSFCNLKPKAVQLGVPATKIGPIGGVVSYGQTGGTTAQTVIQNQTINNYFANQSVDEKETLRKSLFAKYPLGYAVFAADGQKQIYVPNGLSYERYFSVVRWSDARVLELTSDVIKVLSPYLQNDGSLGLGPLTLDGNESSIRRKVGAVCPLYLLPPIEVLMELLEDRGDFVVLALGFRQTTASGLPSPPKKPKSVSTKRAP
jgi:hypothetical protein